MSKLPSRVFCKSMVNDVLLINYVLENQQVIWFNLDQLQARRLSAREFLTEPFKDKY